MDNKEENKEIFTPMGKLLESIINTQYGNEVLTRPSLLIEEVTEEIRKDAKDMLEFVNMYRCWGLAYPQVGKNLRLFVVNSEFMPKDYSSIFVNPELRAVSQEIYISSEGCLSLNAISVDKIERFHQVKVKYYDLDGKDYEIEALPILSIILQHELDHLDGKLIIDHCSRLQRNIVIQKFNKTKRKLERLRGY